ncbi:HD domain-containing phosphohydrolase [Thiolapillus sp.]|uniref:HD domain-containing phosphohydrolase n=1 Tax=Thiolapillus sp. TaxID=2017437 RepID=UPI003AF5EFA0
MDIYPDRGGIEAKIIAVADVFQAMSQKRPYRDELSAAEILSILQQQKQEGKLDKDVVTKIENNLFECWQSVKGATQENESNKP